MSDSLTDPSSERTNRNRPLLAFLSAGAPALLLYIRTLMPDVGYWDTAEFQAIGPVLGVAHPTGYPAYTLLAWLASVVLQPFGNEAFRANLLSALLVACACGLIAALVAYITRRLVAGVGAAVIFAVGTRAWGIALHADPHAFHLFLASVLLVLLVVWADRQRSGLRADRFLVIAAVVFGVSLANHALTLLLAPGIALYVLIVYPGILRRLRLISACAVALVGTTIVLYAYLPIRSAMNPPLDYANPQTWDNFRYVVFGEQFQGTFSQRPPLSDQLRLIVRENWEQLGVLFPLAALGLILGFVRRPALIVMLVAWFALNWWFAIGYENADIGRYYLVPLMCVAVLGGLGVAALLKAARTLVARFRERARDVARWALAVAAAVVLIVPAIVAVPVRFNGVDESNDHSARQWLESLGHALPANAVIVSWWSYSTPLWYGQYVEGWRRDVTVIDDRTILDQNLGNVEQVVDSYFGKRPVFLIRVAYDYPAFRERYVLSPLPGVNGEAVYEVDGYQPAATTPNL